MTGRAPGAVRHDVPWSLTTLLSILFTSLHAVHDVVVGFEGGGLSNLTLVLILVVWLCGTWLLAGRRSGYVVVLVMSLLASAIPVLHMTGKSGITAGIEEPAGAFFFAWTLIALGVTAVFSVILSAQGLWMLRRGRARKPEIESPQARPA